MTKTILTEITIFICISLLSVGLYHLIFGIELNYDNYFDLLTFETRRTVTILEIAGIFLLPTYILLNIGRQIYFRFLSRLLAFEIFISCLLLGGLLFYKYLLLSSDGIAMATEGWTIYPPLSGLSTLDEHDPLEIQNEKIILLTEIIAAIVLGLVLTLLTFRRRKSTGV